MYTAVCVKIRSSESFCHSRRMKSDNLTDTSKHDSFFYLSIYLYANTNNESNLIKPCIINRMNFTVSMNLNSKLFSCD